MSTWRASRVGSSAAWLALPVAGLVAFFAYPLVIVAGRSITDAAGRFTLSNYARLWDDPGLPHALLRSLWVSTATTAATLAAGLIVAMALCRSRLAAKPVVRAVLVLPMLAPSLVLALGVVCLLGRNGLLHRMTGWNTDIYGFWGILLANSMYALPQVVYIVAAALDRAPAREYDAAACMGASAWRQFMDVTLPRLRFALCAAAFLVFAETLTDFGSAVIVGGSYRVLAVEIYGTVVGQLDFALGAALGMALLLPAAASVALGRLARRRQEAGPGVSGGMRHPPRNAVRDACLAVMTFIILLPVVATVVTVAFVSAVHLWPYDMHLTLSNYASIREGFAPIATSLQVAACTAAAGTALVVLLAAAAHRAPAAVARALQILGALPAAVPGMVLGLGYVMAFNHGPLSSWMYGSMAVVAASSLYHYHAQALLTVQAGVRHLPAALTDAVSAFGGGMVAWLRDAAWPFAAPAAISTFFYLFMRSLVTLSAVIFLVTPDLGLASVTIMRLDENGQLAQAAAYAMCLVIAGALAMGAMRLLLHILKDRHHVA